MRRNFYSPIEHKFPHTVADKSFKNTKKKHTELEKCALGLEFNTQNCDVLGSMQSAYQDYSKGSVFSRVTITALLTSVVILSATPFSFI
jgi:hypothetical protein